MVKILLSIVLSCGLIGSALGVDNPSAKPAVPALPTNFSLVKKFTYRDKTLPEDASETAKAAAAFLSRFPRPLQVEVVQTGAVRKEDVRMTDGSRWENWKSGEYRFSVNESSPDYIDVSAPGMSLYQVAEKADFEELTWLSGATSAGEGEKNGRKCAIFRSGDQTVWLELSSGFPVQLESPTMQVTYTFKNPPTESLRLPEKFNKRLEEVSKAWAGRPN